MDCIDKKRHEGGKIRVFSPPRLRLLSPIAKDPTEYVFGVTSSKVWKGPTKGAGTAVNNSNSSWLHSQILQEQLAPARNDLVSNGITGLGSCY